MKNIIKMAGVAAVALALTSTLQATQITGNIGFTGSVTYDTSSPGTASEVTSWVAPTIVSPSLPTGTFSGVVLPGQNVTFTSSIWTFADSTTINPFWMVDGFTFELLNSHIVSQGVDSGKGFVVVSGTGIVSGNGFTPTTMTWSFESQDPPAGANPISWSFAASANSVSTVPDGGATVMLLGIALSGVALLKKKLTA
jgi:hypothetical protein